MKAKGFTLIELMVVVAIVGLLATVAAPLAELGLHRAKETELRQSLRQIREAIDAYKRASDEGRIERKAGESGYPPSLAALVEGVTDKTHPEGAKIYFLRRIPRDPITGEEWGLRSYAAAPDAPQPGKDVFDVHSRSPDTGLNQIPYKEW